MLQAAVNESKRFVKTRKQGGLVLELPVENFQSMTIPGLEGNAKIGTCYIRVTDVPEMLDYYMKVNPRVPNRNANGVLSGPVVKGIMETLLETPEEMAIKNRGIFLLVDRAYCERTENNDSKLKVTLADPAEHGIVDGGHTYAAIREVVSNAGPEDLEALKSAWVRLHIYSGIDADMVPEMAEGLNRGRQVDDPSLANLQGDFDVIRKALKGMPGADTISYHQGGDGEVYISEILVYLELMNNQRFGDRKQPNGLYNRLGLGLKYFTEDMADDKQHTMSLIHMLPEFLRLGDTIRKATPIAAKHNNFKFGQIKVGGERSGGEGKEVKLPFLDDVMAHRVPNGWVYPMLSAFRANLSYSAETKAHSWIIPLQEIVPAVIDGLVSVCIAEHRDNAMRPELMGKKESAYKQCYTEILLFLARRRKL